MVSSKLSKVIAQPIAGLTLLAVVATAHPIPTVAQVPAATQSEQRLDYTLGGGDRIRINVFEVPEYSGEYQIPPGGTVYLPLIGGVSVLGLTQEQAAEAIRARYSRFLKRPIVTVSLLAPRPINVVVSGEVNRPGSYTVGLQGGAGDNPGVQYPTVVGALTLAEGVTLSADLRQVQLRRRTAAGEQVTNLDLTQLVRQGNLGEDITLRDGDIVYVPTASNVNLAEIRQFSTASFAGSPTRPRTVTVVGEVNRPGSYVVTGGSAVAAATTEEDGAAGAGGGGSGLPTVSRAIQLAGGIKPLANVRNVQIRRFTKTGTEQTINVDFWRLLQAGDTNQDTIVQEGDTVFVPTASELNPAEATTLADANFSPATIQVSVVGEVKTPGVVNIPPNTPLNQAILSAGGFNNSRARRSTVQLVRLNPDGSVTKRDIKVDLSQGINEQGNPILRDNDIVVVNRSGVARVGDFVGTVVSPITGVFSILRFLGL